MATSMNASVSISITHASKGKKTSVIPIANRIYAKRKKRNKQKLV